MRAPRFAAAPHTAQVDATPAHRSMTSAPTATARPNKSAIRRAAAAAAAVARTEPDPLPAELAAYLATFTPQKRPPSTYRPCARR